MKLSRNDFNYELPPKLVAQTPLSGRSDSKLLVFQNDRIIDSAISALKDHIEPGTLFIRNNSRVIPSRILGETSFGGRVEVMLIEPVPEEGICCWKALGKPLKKMKVGSVLKFGDIEAEVISKTENIDTPFIHVNFNLEWDEFYSWIEREGYIPLPPYIKRENPKVAPESDDTLRYQTVYADTKGSVAAPTAGLHFTNELIATLKEEMNVSFADVTLHVGAGTFLPVKTQTIENHLMHSERYFIPSSTYTKIRDAQKDHRNIISVGTTSLRTLESFYLEGKEQENWQDLLDRWNSTDLFIYPKSTNDRYRPGLVDGIMTNFHQPESTLLMLISSLVGYHGMEKIYRHAIEMEYRFFSYGDSSLLMFDS